MYQKTSINKFVSAILEFSGPKYCIRKSYWETSVSLRNEEELDGYDGKIALIMMLKLLLLPLCRPKKNAPEKERSQL